MAKTRDVIVIGGGHNGLVTACYLAKAGRQVLVLESRHQLGGTATSEEIFPGFFANTGSHYVNSLQQTVITDLDLASHGLQLQESEVSLFAPQLNGPALTLWQDLQRSQDEIAAFDEQDAKAWPDFVSSMNAMSKVLHSTFLKSPPDIMHGNLKDIYAWGGVAFGLKRLGRKQMMEFLRILPMPVSDLLQEWFSHPLLQGVLAASGVTGLDVGPRAGGTAMMCLYQNIGGWLGTRSVAGGMEKLTMALQLCASGLGVEIRCNAKVSKILVEENKGYSTKGVRLENGDFLPANIIASNADPRQTLFDLLGAQYLEPSIMRQVRNIDYKGSDGQARSGSRSITGVHRPETP